MLSALGVGLSVGVLVVLVSTAVAGFVSNRWSREWLFAVAGSALALIRLGILWYLLIFHWTDVVTTEDLLLTLVILPEGLLLESRFTGWTFPGALLVSGLVVMGSFGFVPNL